MALSTGGMLVLPTPPSMFPTGWDLSDPFAAPLAPVVVPVAPVVVPVAPVVSAPTLVSPAGPVADLSSQVLSRSPRFRPAKPQAACPLARHMSARHNLSSGIQSCRVCPIGLSPTLGEILLSNLCLSL